MWGRNDSDHPFSNYEFGQIVKKGHNEFVMRKYTDVLFKVTGYGTDNPIYTKDVYNNPTDLALTIMGGGDGSVNSLPMSAEEILDFALTFPKHFIDLSNRSLEELCHSSIAKNITLFNIQILPNDLKEDLEKLANPNRKTI